MTNAQYKKELAAAREEEDRRWLARFSAHQPKRAVEKKAAKKG